MTIKLRHLDVAKHGKRAFMSPAASAGSLVLLLVALLPAARCYGNPLGITVANTADARELLQQSRAPGLGSRRCVVVTFVDPVGPCAGSLLPGMAITQINGESIADETAFTQASDKIKPGMEVVIKGLFVRRGVGSKGAWAVGATKIQIPETDSRSDDKTNSRSEMIGTSGSDLRRMGGTEKSVAVPMTQLLSEPRTEPRSEMGNSRRENPESAAALRLGQLKEDGDVAADVPCVPFGVSCEGFAEYDQNDPHFSKEDYTKGPSGQKLYTVYFLDRGEDDTLCPTTAEGYLLGDIDARADSMENAAELQNYLREAVKADRFCFHGRFALWEVTGEMPHTSSDVGDGTQDRNVIGLWKGKVRPHLFNWYWGGLIHGVSRGWSKDGTAHTIGRYVHGVKHLSHEGENREERWAVPYTLGLKHGQCRSWWKNGNRKGQWESNWDKLTGDYLEFYENGAPQLAQKYDRGLVEGVETQWFEDGTVKVRCEWKAGELDGKWEDFFPNGRRKSISYWKNGELAKDEQCWDEEGREGIGRRKPVSPYEVGFQQGVAMGQEDYLLAKTMEARGGGLKDALGRIRGRLVKFRGELVEAEASVAKGADSRLLDVAKGRYEGYVKELGPYGKQ